MKRTLLSASLVIMASVAFAQETYDNAQLATEDLNGTARYIGMGGAMEALGADISTINTNPAGIGMFRKSWVGISGGLTAQSGDKYNGISSTNGVTNVDFNQMGFVYSSQTNGNSWFNLAFNYHKSRNFNQIMTAVNSLNDASNNKMSYISYLGRDLSLVDRDLWINKGYDSRWDYATDMEYINDDVVGQTLGGYSAANGYVGRYDNHGYVSNFNFNFSGNIHNRIFVGVSLGLKSVNYYNDNYYDESLVDVNNYAHGTYNLSESRNITGSGFDIKFGAIFLPVEDSPFRIGLYLHTPTWYDLECTRDLNVAAQFNDYNLSATKRYKYDYYYKITTPWKFGISMGHTINNIVAIGATYEYADYSSIKNKLVEYDDYGIYYKDETMDRNTKSSLKGVHTAKIGIEVKPVPEVAIRMGYNYVSPAFKTTANKSYLTDIEYSDASIGRSYTTYDYINWKATNRLTFGLGFAISENFNLDISYQYSMQKGEYHPFNDINDVSTYSLVAGKEEYTTFKYSNIGTPTTVKNTRHQINATLGYRF